MISISELEAKAKAAKHTPWTNDGSCVIRANYESFYVGNDDDASFISYANPDTILALVKVCRAAKECSLGCMADKLREALKEISE